jgi:hypothetical protein
MTREKQLACALLWLRNHYDCSVPDSINENKKRVLARIDRVLDIDPPAYLDMRTWREDEVEKASARDRKTKG